jgi:hypothetical protein
LAVANTIMVVVAEPVKDIVRGDGRRERRAQKPSRFAASVVTVAAAWRWLEWSGDGTGPGGLGDRAVPQVGGAVDADPDRGRV